MEPKRRQPGVNITKHEEIERKMNVDNINVMNGLHGEVKTTNGMVSKIQQEQAKLTGTEILFLVL